MQRYEKKTSLMKSLVEEKLVDQGDDNAPVDNATESLLKTTQSKEIILRFLVKSLEKTVRHANTKNKFFLGANARRISSYEEPT